MFLTREELFELTARKRSAAQARMLRGLGIEHKIRADGAIIVLRAHVEHLLSGSAPKRRAQKEYEINRSFM